MADDKPKSKLDQLRELRERKFGGGREAGAPSAETHALPRATSAAERGSPAKGSLPPKPSRKGRPRIGEKRDKPWEKAGMSERTWYRRQQEKAKP